MKHHFTIRDGLQAVSHHRKSFEDPNEHAACFASLLKHGSLEVELYQPVAVDQQQPHSKDELYVIATGSGDFEMAGQARTSVTVGDVLFVPAGVEHRFVDFSEDFSTWVFLYGPDGGEAASD